MPDVKKPSEPEQSGSTAATDQTEELEIVTDFDDLNLEIVSEKSQDRSSPDSSLDKSDLSIDDFVIEKQESSSNANQRKSDQWFLKILEQEMGPFSFEDLVTLVADNEVGSEDFIRNGQQGEWIVAGEIAGLIPDSAEDDFELGGGAEFHGDASQSVPVSSASQVQVIGGEANHALSAPRSTPIKSQQQSTPQQKAPNQKEEIPEKDEQQDKSQAQSPAPSETPEDVEEAKKQEIANRLNAWLGDQVGPVEENKQQETEQGEESQATPAAPAPHSPSATHKPPAYVAPSKIKKVKQPREKMDFSGLKNLLDPKLFIGLGVVAAVVAGMFLMNIVGGTDDEAIYLRYKEIYAQILRAREGNPGQIAQIADEAIPELEEIVVALKNAGAGARKPAKKNLYSAGKFCLLPILKDKAVEPGILDEKFVEYQKEASKLLGIK